MTFNVQSLVRTNGGKSGLGRGCSKDGVCLRAPGRRLLLSGSGPCPCGGSWFPRAELGRNQIWMVRVNQNMSKGTRLERRGGQVPWHNLRSGSPGEGGKNERAQSDVRDCGESCAMNEPTCDNIWLQRP